MIKTYKNKTFKVGRWIHKKYMIAPRNLGNERRKTMFRIRKNISAKNLDYYLRYMVTDEAHLAAWVFLKEHGQLVTLSTTSRKGTTESVGYDYKGVFAPISYVDSQIEWYSKKLNV